jgi:hypothetical protein
VVYRLLYGGRLERKNSETMKKPLEPLFLAAMLGAYGSAISREQQLRQAQTPTRKTASSRKLRDEVRAFVGFCPSPAS